MPHLQVIRSSSAGNCTLLWNETACLVIDAGIPVSLLKQHLEKNDLTLDAALITHGHRDHLSNACCNYFRTNAIPLLFGNASVAGYYETTLSAMAKGNGTVRLFMTHPFEVGPFRIVPFEVSHDSEGGCYAFTIQCGTKKISYATDLVHAPHAMAERFRDSDLIVIESNHDPIMLENSNRPYYLKQRIRERAHLSNKKSCDFIRTVLSLSSRMPHTIVLAHISTECNERELALKEMRDTLNLFPSYKIEAVLTYRDKESRKITL